MQKIYLLLILMPLMVCASSQKSDDISEDELQELSKAIKEQGKREIIARLGLETTFKDPLGDIVKKYGIDMLKEVLKSKDFDINIRDFEDNTLLINAVKNRNLPMIKLLLGNRADVNLKNKYKFNALQYATDPMFLGNLEKNGNKEIVELLINAGTDKESNNNALISAASNGDDKIVELMLDKTNADVNFSDTAGRTALTWAIKGNHKNIIIFLISHGADVNINRELWKEPKPLCLAIDNKLYEIFYILVKNGARDETGCLKTLSITDKELKEAIEKFDKWKKFFKGTEGVHSKYLKGINQYAKEFRDAQNPEISQQLRQYMISDVANIVTDYLKSDNPWEYFIKTYHTEFADEYDRLVKEMESSSSSKESEKEEAHKSQIK